MNRLTLSLITLALIVMAGCDRGAETKAPAAAARNIPTAPPDHMIIIFGDGEPDVGPAPLTVEFTTDFPFPNIEDPQFHWDFGDGSAPSTEKRPTHTYTKPGKYIAKVRVTDRGADDEDTISIFVK